MRLIMMGTGPFAVPTFRALQQTEHEVAALVTKPVAEVRTRKPAPRHPMRETAEQLGVPHPVPRRREQPGSSSAVGRLAPGPAHRVRLRPAALPGDAGDPGAGRHQPARLAVAALPGRRSHQLGHFERGYGDGSDRDPYDAPLGRRPLRRAAAHGHRSRRDGRGTRIAARDARCGCGSGGARSAVSLGRSIRAGRAPGPRAGDARPPSAQIAGPRGLVAECPRDRESGASAETLAGDVCLSQATARRAVEDHSRPGLRGQRLPRGSPGNGRASDQPAADCGDRRRRPVPGPGAAGRQTRDGNRRVSARDILSTPGTFSRGSTRRRLRRAERPPRQGRSSGMATAVPMCAETCLTPGMRPAA